MCGTDGTVKLMAVYSSLQWSVTGQTVSPKSWLEFANFEIPFSLTEPWLLNRAVVFQRDKFETNIM